MPATSTRGRQGGVGTFRIGDSSGRKGVFRIAATRRPPRGVRKEQWHETGRFDVWFPTIAPSAALLQRIRPAQLIDDAVRARFFAAYARELARPEARHVIELLAALGARVPLAVGCYCEDEERCHRSVLKRTIDEASRRR